MECQLTRQNNAKFHLHKIWNIPAFDIDQWNILHYQTFSDILIDMHNKGQLFLWFFLGELSENVMPHLLDNKCSITVITAGKCMLLKYFYSWRNGLERLPFHQSGRTVERKYGRKLLYNFCRVAFCQTPLASIKPYLFFWCNHIKRCDVSL